MEPKNIEWLKRIIADMPDDAVVIVNGGQGNKNTTWSIEAGQDDNGNQILEIMY